MCAIFYSLLNIEVGLGHGVLSCHRYHRNFLKQAELCLSCRDFCLHYSSWGCCSSTSWLGCLGISFGFQPACVSVARLETLCQRGLSSNVKSSFSLLDIPVWMYRPVIILSFFTLVLWVWAHWTPFLHALRCNYLLYTVLFICALRRHSCDEDVQDPVSVSPALDSICPLEKNGQSLSTQVFSADFIQGCTSCSMLP